MNHNSIGLQKVINLSSQVVGDIEESAAPGVKMYLQQAFPMHKLALLAQRAQRAKSQERQESWCGRVALVACILILYRVSFARPATDPLLKLWVQVSFYSNNQRMLPIFTPALTPKHFNTVQAFVFAFQQLSQTLWG